jgi:nicotinamidase/pyrazinamidase
VINGLIPRFEHIVFTRDWHPRDHFSFSREPLFTDGSWPVHCVAGSPGAAFHAEIDIPEAALVVSKGTDSCQEAYSGFQGTSLAAELRARGVKRLFVCGLATDYCVKGTALDGVRLGFQVVLVKDACRGVDIPPGSVARALEEMKQNGIELVSSGEVL